MEKSDKCIYIPPSGSDMSSNDGIERLLSPRDGMKEVVNVGARD